jgi:hypothetical protein
MVNNEPGRKKNKREDKKHHKVPYSEECFLKNIHSAILPETVYFSNEDRKDDKITFYCVPQNH